MRTLVVLAAFALGTPARAEQKGEKPPTKPLVKTQAFDQATLRAWQQRSAWAEDLHWSDTSSFGLEFRPLSKYDPAQQPPMIPFLGFNEGNENVLSDLPSPKVPFGISLDSWHFTDATLQALPRFTNL